MWGLLPVGYQDKTKDNIEINVLAHPLYIDINILETILTPPSIYCPQVGRIVSRELVDTTMRRFRAVEFYLLLGRSALIWRGDCFA
jgi:hypothetical protein